MWQLGVCVKDLIVIEAFNIALGVLLAQEEYEPDIPGRLERVVVG